ncbi:hypothetical protein IG631_15123 [Alternaria alternata]|nr:hypothetical protein IG631_15123 [Alternaria alternata]
MSRKRVAKNTVGACDALWALWEVEGAGSGEWSKTVLLGSRTRASRVRVEMSVAGATGWQVWDVCIRREANAGQRLS